MPSQNGRTPGRRPPVEVDSDPEQAVSPITPNVSLDEEIPPIPIPAPRNQSDSTFSYGYGYGYTPTQPPSGLARTIRASVTGKRAALAVPVVDLGTAVSDCTTASPKNENEESSPLWGRWDVDRGHTPRTTRLLFVVYPSTLRVWDTTDLENVSEVLRLPYASLESDLGEARVVHVGVLPARKEKEKSLIGLAFNTGVFIIYSLNTHRVVSRLLVGDATIHSFEASEDIIVISTSSPPGLHIFSSTTYTLLTEIPASRLSLYAPPPHLLNGNGNGNGELNVQGVSASAKAMLSSAFGAGIGVGGTTVRRTAGDWDVDVDVDLDLEDEDPKRTRPRPRTRNAARARDVPPAPVYALSNRLLAYACTASPASRSRSTTTTSVSANANATNTRQQSVWEGMRTLGGLAVSVARSRIAGGAGGGVPGGVGRFFSRSAPERRGGSGNVHADAEREKESEADRGVYIRILDLQSLLLPKPTKPDVVVEFRVDSAVGKLSWGKDGCVIGVVGREGMGVGVYQVRPRPGVRVGGVRSGEGEGVEQRGEGEGEQREGEGAAWNVYHLRRGRTRALVDAVEWSLDGRWVGMATRKGTVHVFGVNPYGGKVDWRSHWEGRVRNVGELQPMPMEMGPLVRLRAGSGPVVGGALPPPPLAFVFVEPREVIPKHLLPPTQSSSPPHPHPHAHPRSYSSQHTHTDTGSSSPPHSPTKKRPTNFQDVLLFDPSDASLSLRRVTIERRSREHGIGIGMGMGMVSGALGAGVTSISLPGMGFAGSPSSVGFGGRVQRKEEREREREREREEEMEVGARESTVMVWSLGGWGPVEGVRKSLGVQRGEGGQDRGGRADWLSQAELSTCSKSSKILPRSIYLSHQFSFYTLGEDYHALIRRYQLDISGIKIDVRREVQVSAYSVGGGKGKGGNSGDESFVEGFASPRDIRHHRTLSASFDEPLASALTNDLEHSRVAGVLPMLPNGTFTPGSFTVRNAIPIRTIGDGMSESLGRLRREINRVRSPRMRSGLDGGTGSASGDGMSPSVPLEFDEEDEDFVSPDVDGPSSHGDEGSGSTSTSTPVTSTSEDDWERKMETREDPWGGWSEGDRVAVEEVERFDDIDVLGLLDEEQNQAKMPMKMQGAGRPVDGKRKRGKRR